MTKLTDEQRAQRAQQRDNEQRERLMAYIKKTVDAAPPLTVEQRSRLAVLLRLGQDE